MMVSVALTDRDPATEGPFVLRFPGAAGVLAHVAHVGAGVHLGVDLADPHRWRLVSSSSLDEVTNPLLQALIGRARVRPLHELLGQLTTERSGRTCGRLRVEPSDAEPWTRVAVVDALDRWLQLPLDQSLVDAERGIARLRAAKSLRSGGTAAPFVIDEAFRLARDASGGVVRYMRKLGSRRRAIPAGLLDAIDCWSTVTTGSSASRPLLTATVPSLPSLRSGG